MQTPEPTRQLEAQPKPNSARRGLSLIATLIKPLGCVTSGVGLGFLIVVLFLGWLLFDVAPSALDSVAGIFGS